MAGRGGPGPADSAGFWLSYWCAAFEHILASSSDDVVLLSYDDCCANPDAVLRELATGSASTAPKPSPENAARLRPSTSYAPDDLGLDNSLLTTALDIHRELLTRSIR